MQDRNAKIIRRITWVGLFVNLLLATAKYTAGVYGNSQAVIADAIHSLSDSTTDIAVLVGSYFWTSPPDQSHPHGHHRIETLVTFFIGLILLGAGIGIGLKAILSLHKSHTGHPCWIAAGTAGASIIVKELLYHWTASAGKRLRSAALTANAWHHRLDAISSIPALLTVSAAILKPSWAIMDSIGAGIVSVLIIQAAFTVMWPPFREIMDAGAPASTIDAIERIAISQSGVKNVHKIRTRYIGMSLQVDLHLMVNGRMSVRDGHIIAEIVKSRILDSLSEVVDVLIHIEPYEKIDLHSDAPLQPMPPSGSTTR